MLGRPGRRLVVGRADTPEAASIAAALRADGVVVRPWVPYANVARLLQSAKTVLVPCTLEGGGERAVLEAIAVGAQLELSPDNPKLLRLAQRGIEGGPASFSHVRYAEQLLGGIRSLALSEKAEYRYTRACPSESQALISLVFLKCGYLTKDMQPPCSSPLRHSAVATLRRPLHIATPLEGETFEVGEGALHFTFLTSRFHLCHVPKRGPRQVLSPGRHRVVISVDGRPPTDLTDALCERGFGGLVLSEGDGDLLRYDIMLGHGDVYEAAGHPLQLDDRIIHDVSLQLLSSAGQQEAGAGGSGELHRLGRQRQGRTDGKGGRKEGTKKKSRTGAAACVSAPGTSPLGMPPWSCPRSCPALVRGPTCSRAVPPAHARFPRQVLSAPATWSPSTSYTIRDLRPPSLLSRPPLPRRGASPRRRSCCGRGPLRRQRVKCQSSCSARSRRQERSPSRRALLLRCGSCWGVGWGKGKGKGKGKDEACGRKQSCGGRRRRTILVAAAPSASRCALPLGCATPPRPRRTHLRQPWQRREGNWHARCSLGTRRSRRRRPAKEGRALG